VHYLRLGKVLTQAQQNARNKAQTDHTEKRDAFRKRYAPFRQGVPRNFQVHMGIMAWPSFSI
jgi:hypothetical protein